MSRARRLVLLSLGFAVVLLPLQAEAASRFSRANNNWTNTATWGSVGCGTGATGASVPGPNDIATICTGTTVTVNAAVTVGELRVAGGTLTQTSSLAVVTTGTSLAPLGVNGRMQISAGTLTSSQALTVNAMTEITGGTLNINLNNANRTFVGNVSVTGGAWTNTGNRPVLFGGGVSATSPGTFSNGTTSTTTFFVGSAAQTLGGDAPMIFGVVTVNAGVTVTRTNDDTVTINGNLNGVNATTSIWRNDAGVLDYLGANAPMVTGVLQANNAANTVRYGRAGAQAVEGTTYRTLELAVSGTKTFNGNVTVNGNTTTSGTAAIAAGSGLTHTFAGSLFINSTAAVPWAQGGANNVVNFDTPNPAAGTTVGPSAGPAPAATALPFLNSVNINNTSGVTFNRDASVSGNLTVGTNAILIPADAIIISGTGTLTGPTAPDRGTARVMRTAATGTPDFLNQYTITNKTYTNLVVDYAATAAQTVNNVAYGHLKLSGSGIKTMPGAALTTTGDFIMAGAAQATALNALTIGGHFDMSEVGNTATFNAGSFTHNVAGNFSKAATSTFNAGTSTFNFNGVAQAIQGAVTFNNLTIANTSTVTPDSNVTVNAHASNSGTIGGTVVLTGGSAAHQLGGTGGVYNNLQINDALGALLMASPTINGTLTLTSGLVTTGSLNTLIIGASGAISGAATTRHVVGNLAKQFNATGSFTYAVGDGSRYVPVDVTFTALPTTGRMTVSATSGDHPDTTAESSSLDPTKSVNRYWTMKNTTAVGTFNATFNYIAGAPPTGDVDSGVITSSLIIARGASCTGSGASRSCSNTWSRPTVGAPGPSTTQSTATGVSTVATESDFAVGHALPVRFSREKEFIFTRELY